MNEPSSDPETNVPLNPPEPEGEDKVRQLMGEKPVEDQSAVLDASDIDSLGALTATELYEGETGASLENESQSGGNDESLDMLTELELRADETDDVMEAIEEGYTYIPPIDPPIVPNDSDAGAEVANGFGVSALDEEYTADTHGAALLSDDEVAARVRDALRNDSSTSAYAAHVAIEVRDGVVTLRGVVDDLDDTDNMAAVAEYVEGVDEVIDELEVRGL